MRPQGTVYIASEQVSGELKIALTAKEKKRFKLMRFIGANLSSFALAFMVYFYGPPFELDLDYQAGLARAQTIAEAVESPVPKVQAAVPSQKPEVREFAISIPSIGASAVVLENINPYDEGAYLTALKKGIAHAAGTGLPGQGRRVYLFAHSTSSPLYFSEYNAVFYQLRLLSENDRIIVKHNGDTYWYKVIQKVTVDADDTHWLTETSTEEELVLQTCDPPGTTLRRLLVIARPAY